MAYLTAIMLPSGTGGGNDKPLRALAIYELTLRARSSESLVSTLRTLPLQPMTILESLPRGRKRSLAQSFRLYHALLPGDY